ncbi:MAG: D-tyrosyl-tRNA(Tyr) deacylase [Syntrophobacteraceae bacterium]|nr:D-tyrosyl-tRNA(Tyr) deacylase [Syntrophobacteraceae bacterium]
MRAVVQRVSEACVDIGGETVGRIGLGVVVFLGVGPDDGPEDVRYMADKVLRLRIFPDDGDKMNLSVLDIRGEVLVVSQFTLYGDCRKGRRPSYAGAAPPEKAQRFYGDFVSELRTRGLRVETGRFQEKMRVRLVNDGPVTLLMDSKKIF